MNDSIVQVEHYLLREGFDINSFDCPLCPLCSGPIQASMEYKIAEAFYTIFLIHDMCLDNETEADQLEREKEEEIENYE